MKNNNANNEQIYEMEARYDKRQCFYHKAYIKQNEIRTTLLSYMTPVSYIEDGKAYVIDIESGTTLRHIKEFLKQNGFNAETKKQILKDYLEK